MRPLSRLLFTLASAVSLVLSVAGVVMGAWSTWQAAVTWLGLIAGDSQLAPEERLWALVGLGATALALFLIILLIPVGRWGERERQKMLPGRCRSCGYDLTGNASGVCPECGTPADG